jgi:hypothetical protein
MNVFEEFLRELFNGEPMIREANICGRSVIGKVDDQIIVKIVLVSTERSKAIDAILCTVLNRYGVIDKQMYLFSEMIRSSPVLRESDGEDGFEEKFSQFDIERIREVVLGYIGKFYDRSHDRNQEGW